MNRRFGLTLALLGAVAARAGSQDVRGTVRDSASQRPIPGAVVQALDAGGRSFARTLTDESGRYLLPRAAQASVVRVLRLGFRPRDLVIPEGAASSVTLDVAMMQLPQLLERVAAIANPVCPRRSDADVTFGVWQQAKAGLLAMVVGREANPARLKLLVFQRVRSSVRDTIVRQSVRIDTGTSTKSFGAVLSASQFARYGFVVSAPDSGRTFFGPDAEVLLSDAFQAAYCFSMASRERARPTQVGLRFSVARRDPARVDIDGTLWIDTAALTIRDIEFRYVGLQTGADRYRPGGYVRFYTSPQGIAVINDWMLRMVTLFQDTIAWRTGRGGSPGDWGNNDPLRFRRFYVTEGGGEMARAEWASGSAHQATLGTIRLRVVDRSGEPLRGRLVQLDSTDYVGTTDSTGEVAFSDVLPGPYLVSIPDSTLSIVGMSILLPTRLVAIRDSTVSATLTVNTPAGALATACGGTPYSGKFRWFVARVTTWDGRPIKDVSWNINAPKTDPRAVATTGADGLILVCKLYDADQRIELHLWREEGTYRMMNPKIVLVTLGPQVTALRIELPVP